MASTHSQEVHQPEQEDSADTGHHDTLIEGGVLPTRHRGGTRPGDTKEFARS
jgi:hypothetical protein